MIINMGCYNIKHYKSSMPLSDLIPSFHVSYTLASIMNNLMHISDMYHECFIMDP